MTKNKNRGDNLPADVTLDPSGAPQTYQGDGLIEGDGYQPGVRELFGMPGDSPHSPVKEMITVSEEPGEWLPRARLTKEDVIRISRMIAIEQGVKRGSIDLPHILRIYAMCTIAVDGKGREDAIRIAGATRRPFMGNRMFQTMRGWGRGG